MNLLIFINNKKNINKCNQFLKSGINDVYSQIKLKENSFKISFCSIFYKNRIHTYILFFLLIGNYIW